MSDTNSVNPNDRSIFQHLYEQEQRGEDAFVSFYKGNPSGADEMDRILKESITVAGEIQDPALRKQAKEFLKSLNQNIMGYIKDSTSADVDALQSKIEDYKSFLKDYK